MHQCTVAHTPRKSHAGWTDSAFHEPLLTRLRSHSPPCPCSTVQFEMDGSPASFDLLFVGSLKTNGGWMFDVVVTFQVG